MIARIWCLLLFAGFSLAAIGQDTLSRCGSMERLQFKFNHNPLFKRKFEQQRTGFNESVRVERNRRNERTLEGAGLVYTIPVVVHIVLRDPSVVTDAQVRAQIDILNKNFFGSNGDSIRIPSYFKSLFGRSGIQFCLAQRTPEGEPTTGIERVVSSQATFSNLTDGVKYSASGGADYWDNKNYFNIWISALDGILGYSSFPEESQPAEEGVVIDYRCLPGGTYEFYREGKTLTHETGHYFNLYHIWGDDKGSCAGTDFVDDTPNQANSTSGCLSGVLQDDCTRTGNGIMYQNYMDYTNDDCLLMFTEMQVSRMESALMQYYTSLLVSPACLPVGVHDYDVELRSVIEPAQRLCNDHVSPVIEIRNRGSQTLTTVEVKALLDSVAVSSFTWTGSLAHDETATVTLGAVEYVAGKHILQIDLQNPDNMTDEDSANNSLSLPFQYFDLVSEISESFESPLFPPIAWDVVNTDKGHSWKPAAGVAKTGNASLSIETTTAVVNGEHDDLRLPELILSSIDSAFLSFQVAAAPASEASQTNASDSFEILISRDCGQTYTIAYTKVGTDMLTRTAAVDDFMPTASEWRKDLVDLGPYINQGAIMIVFRKTAGSKNRLYLDDVFLRKVIVNPNLKEEGFLATPNPARTTIAVQFYPQPANLRAIQVFNARGQKVTEIMVKGNAFSYYPIDVNAYPAGVYLIRAVFTDKTLFKKIIKL